MFNSKEFVLNLCGTQELREASDAHARVLNALKANSSIVLDFAELADVDLTFVQLIESARLSAAQQGKVLSLSAPASGALLAVLERGGFLGDATDPRTQFWLAA